MSNMSRFQKSGKSPSTAASQQHGIMTSPYEMMKNSCVKVVIKYQSSDILSREDIVKCMQKVAKQ